tara:strand:- start:441 stop:761 length:321 start_codon:yes stop_codon:yes gene_type:complete
MKFKPLHDRVLIRRLESDERSSGGIIIPDTAQEKPMQGEVVSAGPGSRDNDGNIVSLEVKAGDKVLFGKFSGTDVTIKSEELVIVKESDILAVIASGGRKAKGKAA